MSDRIGTADGTIAVFVNGEQREVAPGLDLLGLVETIGLDRRKVAIERNAAIVPRSLHGRTLLVAGDRIEIVHFVGGG